jgi:hypothetical protein
MRELPRSVYFAVLAAFSLSVLTAFRQFWAGGAPLGDDASSHYAEVLTVAETLARGSTDFWCPRANLGYPLFLYYQPLPALFMGALVAVFELDAMAAFKASLVLLSALIPLTSYLGARWAGADRLFASVLAVLSISIADPTRFGFALSSIAGGGLYTQLYGMALFPLVLGAVLATLRAEKPRFPRSVLLLALLTVCHPYFALFVVLAAAATVERPRRLAAIVLCSLPFSAFFWLPLLLNLEGMGGFPLRTTEDLGLPVSAIFELLFGGELFDFDRLPLLSIAVFAGAVLSIRRRAARALWIFSGAALALVAGVAPLFSAIRFAAALQLAALLFAAIALTFALRRFPWALLLLAVFSAAERRSEIERLFVTFDDGHPAFVELIERVESETHGRYLTHQKLGTGGHIFSALVGARARRDTLMSAGRGYHDSKSLKQLLAYDFSPRQTELYAIDTAISYGEVDLVDLSKWTVVYAREGYRLHRAPHAASMYAFSSTAAALIETAQTATEHRARLTLPEPTRAVLKVSHHAFWSAELGGRPVEVKRTDENLIAVDLPAGAAELVLRYRTPLYQKALFFLALAATFGWLARSIRATSRS